MEAAVGIELGFGGGIDAMRKRENDIETTKRR